MNAFGGVPCDFMRPLKTFSELLIAPYDLKDLAVSIMRSTWPSFSLVDFASKIHSFDV